MTWLSVPWRTVYTLNVDDLADAADRKFVLPRHPVSGSAVTQELSPKVTRPDQFPVIHLNGRIVDGLDRVTFDVTQYARRLNEEDPSYALLASELLAFPFVFVGTAIDESIFWQHIELRRRRGPRERELRPRCYLVLPTLSRARRDLLQEYNIVWVQAKGREFAESVLASLKADVLEGLESARQSFIHEKDDISNIRDVSDLLARAPRGKTEFLNGAEPAWEDVLDGRAISRSMDERLVEQCKHLLVESQSNPNGPAAVVVVTGTAGSGKSTALMRLAVSLSASGTTVAWVGRDTEVSPKQLHDFWRSDAAPAVLAIDEADRYGTGLGPLLGDMASANAGRLLVLSLRATKVERTFDAADVPESVRKVEFVTPLLSDEDIDGLLAVLTKDNRLGRLTNKPREKQVQAFREQCGRQLLVAMIQATSGRRFEEKVLEEWSELSEDGRFIYVLLAIATALRYKPTKSELLLASGASRDSGDLKILSDLVNRHIVAIEKQLHDRYSVRHRVIAEKLIDQLASRGEQLTKAVAGLAFAVSAQLSPRTERQEWTYRFMKALMNHDYLFRMCGLDGSRSVYDAIESNLQWDHHFWLQRGSLEVANGDIRAAEQWLETAKSWNSSDAFVMTEYAYMLMRKAIALPESSDAPNWIEQGTSLLRGQIAARGKRDTYPYHILGMQALGWAAKGRMGKADKKLFLASVLQEVKDGAVKHPKAKELRELRDTLQKELWGLEVK